MSETPKAPLTGRHVLFFLFAFFGIVFAVNGYFLTSALKTYTGVVSVEPYRKGLEYNNRIAADDAQKALGWSGDVTAALDGALNVKLLDKSSAPLPGKVVTAVIGRPSTNQYDRTLKLTVQPDGTYAGSAGRLDNGTWMVSVDVRDSADAADPVYRFRRRLWLKP